MHLSDVHVVGERYGFRIESGRSGPRGNERLKRLLAELEAIHAKDPFDLVLITGDMTDAGSSAEWAEFLDAMAAHPNLAERALILPGNHDLNIVDRANPARLDLPTSPDRRLRQLRTLSAMDELQGDRVRVVELRTAAARQDARGSSRAASQRRWCASPMGQSRSSPARSPSSGPKVFPMVLPPARDDGLGVILLNSNAETHFSFTNALGIVSAEQVRGIEIATEAISRAPAGSSRCITTLVEYPSPRRRCRSASARR